MKNQTPCRLLCLTTATRVAIRYEDRKRVGACRIPAVENINWQTLAALEIFRDRGYAQAEPQTS